MTPTGEFCPLDVLVIILGGKMAIFARKLNGKQRAWCKKYERNTTFEPMYQEDLDSGEINFDNFAKANIGWFEDWASEMLLSISNYPDPKL